MKAVFIGDILDIKELYHYIGGYTEESVKYLEEDIKVIKEVHLEEEEYKETQRNLNQRRDWIKRNEGKNMGDVTHVIQVNNIDTEEKFFVNNEGYKHPKYVGIEV